MSEIIERGAEAMRAKRRELIAQPLDRIWPDLMRAAVAAMREPTDQMVDAATTSTSGYGGPDHDYDYDVAIHWNAMIDAALEASTPIPQHRLPEPVRDPYKLDTTQEKT